MICDHLRPLEERIISRGFVESQRGAPWPRNCREWVTYNCDVRVIAKLEGINTPNCVKHYEYSDIHFGSETGLVCEEHHDALISGVLSGPALTAFLGIESMASPDGTLEVAYLVWGDYDRGGTYRAPRIIRIATSEVLVDLWDSVWNGAVQFEGGGNVTLTLPRYPQDIRLHIDASSKTFSFDQSPDQREPLELLTARLEPLRQKPASYVAAVQPPSTRQFLWALFMLAVSLVFVAIALWIIVLRPPGAPIVAAWVGVVFFGACAASAANDLKKRKRA